MPGAKHALIVATDTYDDPKLDALRAPAGDAQALGEVLADPAIGGFDVAYATNPSADGLRRTVSEFFADRSGDDLLLLHIGCHGLKDEDGRLYFAASDTRMQHLDATAVAADFVNRRMGDSYSDAIVLLLDCCYSGAFGSGMTSRAGETVDIGERFEGSGRVVLTASSAMEYSFEGEQRSGKGDESVFTAALVHGLRTGEADRDADHWITVEELYRYVYERVRKTTSKQRPHKWSFMEGDLRLARSTWVRPVEDLALPPQLSALATSVVPSLRCDFINEVRTLVALRPQYEKAAREALTRLCDDDSKTVERAAAAALAELSAAGPQVAEPAIADAEPAPVADDPPPEPAPAPQPDETAAPPRGLRQLLRPTSTGWIVAAAALFAGAAGFVGHELAWELGKAVEIGSTEAGTGSGAIYTAGRFLFPIAALAWVLAAAGRSRWGTAASVALSTLAGTLLVGLAMLIPLTSERLDLAFTWGLRGAIVGVAALLGTRDAGRIARAAGCCAATGALWGLVAPRMAGAEMTAVILVRSVLPLMLLGAVAGALIARAPRRSEAAAPVVSPRRRAPSAARRAIRGRRRPAPPAA